MANVQISFETRPYQKELIYRFRGGVKHAYCVWHRKAGKDRVATFIESELACSRVGLYWHALPKYEDARKVIWDAITPDGKRLIDVNFPPQIIKRRLDHEMKLELVNGSIWQPVGADNYDSLVGAFPVHVTYSEYPLMDPRARDFLRPALAINNGSELVIGTPRGFNHGYDLWNYSKGNPEWYTSLLTVDDTGILPADVLAEEKRNMPDELFRQEYYCDWSAANVGSILGRYLEDAEKSGRVGVLEPDSWPVEISGDLGFRDTCAWWFWQRKPDGYGLIDYDEDTGLDASEWIPRLQKRVKDLGVKIDHIFLPHDAKAKTFQTRRSAVEQFLQAFGNKVVSVVPQTKKQDQINAARLMMRKSWFHVKRCEAGLKALRSWQFKWDEEKKTFSKEPDHDWASHAADAFCCGAVVMQERIVEDKKDEKARGVGVGYPSVTLNELWAMAPKRSLRI